MINFSKISNKSLVGKVLRWPLILIPKNFTLFIIHGSNKNFKWIKESGVNGYWLGCYESKKQRLIASHIKKGMTCYDIGAHVGFYSLMFSKLSGEKGRVYTFEPSPRNLYFLLKHISINNLSNVIVFPVGLSNEKNYLPFISNGNKKSSQSHFINGTQETSNTLIPVDKIDNLVSKAYIKPPNIVKIDVEGHEFKVLEGMKNTLENNLITLFIALDDKSKRRDIFLFLQNLGYTMYDLNTKKINLNEIINIEEIIGKKNNEDNKKNFQID